MIDAKRMNERSTREMIKNETQIICRIKKGMKEAGRLGGFGYVYTFNDLNEGRSIIKRLLPKLILNGYEARFYRIGGVILLRIYWEEPQDAYQIEDNLNAYYNQLKELEEELREDE